MNLRRTAASAAILTALSMLLMAIMWAVVIPNASGLTQDDMMNPVKIGAFALGHHGLWTIGCISDAIAGITIPLLTIGLYRKFKKSQPGRATLLALFGIMSGILFFIAGAISLLAPTFVAKLANPAETFAALGAIQQPIETASVFLIALSTWQASRAAQTANAFNAITIYAGYLGALGALMYPIAIVNPELGANPMIMMLPMLGSIIFNFGIGIGFMNAQKNPELEAVLA